MTNSPRKTYRIKKIIRKEPHCFEGYYKNHHIEIGIDEDTENGTFYCTVTSAAGAYLVEGYAPPEMDKIDDAIEWALIGAKLIKKQGPGLWGKLNGK